MCIYISLILYKRKYNLLVVFNISLFKCRLYYIMNVVFIRQNSILFGHWFIRFIMSLISAATTTTTLAKPANLYQHMYDIYIEYSPYS